MLEDRSPEPPDRADPGVDPGLVGGRDGDAAAHDAGDAPSPSDTTRTRSRAHGPLDRLLSVLRGDKYMADAYEPARSALMEGRTRATQKER
jgi:hypothetical protein